jgi:hypothetical protein
VSFATIALCVASQLVFIVVVYFVIESVRKLLDTPSYTNRLIKAGHDLVHPTSPSLWELHTSSCYKQYGGGI